MANLAWLNLKQAPLKLRCIRAGLSLLLTYASCLRNTTNLKITTLNKQKRHNMLCNTFKQLASNTWDKIAESRQVNFPLKEETFTDINMLDLKLHHSGQVRTTVFSKPVEGKNGADWEWWFNLNNNQWIGFRVQAKILNINSEEFEHLHYQNPATGIYQCDNLIENALTRTHPKIPLYCFYLQTDNTARLTNWSCGSFAPTRNLWGCSLLSAFEVKRLRAANHKHLSHIENLMKPWHCLVCCSGYGGGQNKIFDISEYAKNNFPLDMELVTDLDVNIPDNFITQKPPNYVTAILANENIKDVQPPDKELDGVMIYTFNERQK